jgi:outer membrane protein TolC
LGDVEQAMLARQAARQSLAQQVAALDEARRLLDAEQSRYMAGDSPL